MDTAKILSAMRILSEGRTFVWACNDCGSMLVELTAQSDACETGRDLVAFDGLHESSTGMSYGARYFFWDGSSASELVDVEEAVYVAEHRIRDLADVARYASARMARVHRDRFEVGAEAAQ
jgi:hypothetical protein